MSNVFPSDELLADTDDVLCPYAESFAATMANPSATYMQSDWNSFADWSMNNAKGVFHYIIFIYICIHFLLYIPYTKLTRALLGGGGAFGRPPPSGFSRLSKIRRRAAPPAFHTPYPHLFRNFCENFDPMPCEVRSPGQVKWPNYKITFQSRHGYNVSGKVMKLSEYDELISAYKTFISDFWYRWPQVRSFLRPPHYKSMGKKSTPLYLLWRKHIWVESYRIGQLLTIRVKTCIAYPSKGHLRSPEVTNRHLPITFD